MWLLFISVLRLLLIFYNIYRNKKDNEKLCMIWDEKYILKVIVYLMIGDIVVFCNEERKI